MVHLRHAAVLITLFAVPAQVHAGGFATARFGGEHGHPTTDNPTAIYYNPAGLALGQGTRIFVEGLFAYRSASYERPVEAIDNISNTGVGTRPGDAAANAGEATLSNMLASPFIGAVSDIGVPNLAIGFGVYAPFGGQASWDKNDEFEGRTDLPGAVDGVQRWATIEGSIREVYFTLGGAYRLPGPRLSFGAGVNVIRQSINTIRARVAAGTDDLVGPTDELVEGRSVVDVNGTTFSLGAGVIWEPMRDLFLGLSYQSQPGFGKSKQSGTLTNKLGAVAVEASEIDFEQELPDVIRFGARMRVISDLELRFAADYTRWSVFEDQCLLNQTGDARCALDESGGNTDQTEGVIVNIHRAWEDTYGARVGASYWVIPRVEIVGGAAYDSSAVPDDTLDASLMDMNKFVGTLGGRFEVVSNLLVNLSYTHVFYLTRETEPRERDEDMDAIAPPAPSRVPDGAGVYRQQIGLVNLGAEYRF